ncbi:hypothetical protein Hanom_Chr07g00614821 [Helianthus anomalus]
MMQTLTTTMNSFFRSKYVQFNMFGYNSRSNHHINDANPNKNCEFILPIKTRTN